MNRVRSCIFLIVIATLAIGCASVPQSEQTSGDTTKSNHSTRPPALKVDGMLLGAFALSDVDTPEFPWYRNKYDSSVVNLTLIPKISSMMTDISILCFAGTWCTDTHKELPHLIKIMDVGKINFEKITFIGIDRQKLSPRGETAPWNITASPTFIFLKNDQEIGRIVESPKKTLEEDIVEILSRAR